MEGFETEQVDSSPLYSFDEHIKTTTSGSLDLDLTVDATFKTIIFQRGMIVSFFFFFAIISIIQITTHFFSFRRK